jgi:DNA-directed RNA polymerase specialized sigma24 family protein
VRLTPDPSGDLSAADPEDFQAFVVSRGAHLFRTACLLTGGGTYLAEDHVQEALSRMFTKWGRRSRVDDPSGYAQTALIDTFISQRRKKGSSELPAGNSPTRPPRATTRHCGSPCSARSRSCPS